MRKHHKRNCLSTALRFFPKLLVGYLVVSNLIQTTQANPTCNYENENNSDVTLNYLAQRTSEFFFNETNVRAYPGCRLAVASHELAEGRKPYYLFQFCDTDKINKYNLQRQVVGNVYLGTELCGNTLHNSNHPDDEHNLRAKTPTDTEYSVRFEKNHVSLAYKR